MAANSFYGAYSKKCWWPIELGFKYLGSFVLITRRTEQKLGLDLSFLAFNFTVTSAEALI